MTDYLLNKILEDWMERSLRLDHFLPEEAKQIVDNFNNSDDLSLDDRAIGFGCYHYW